MMTYTDFWQRLAKHYDTGEAKAIARMVYEVRFGRSLSDLYLGKDEEVDQSELEAIAVRLERQEPVQYVLGTTDFLGRSFHTDRRALIPRPETAELCEWIAECRPQPDKLGEQRQLSVLDIGTGSGCIAITLASVFHKAVVEAWDLSAEALSLARENAQALGVDVCFRQQDALHIADDLTSRYDIIVSNPPYICQQEAQEMEHNVLDYEPHQALFVPDDDPLLFYRAIADYAVKALQPQGQLFFEINPLYVQPLCTMLKEKGLSRTETREDAFGKMRFIKSQR